ncbi:MBL fold metallo-hydrolase [Pedobacter sp. P351]|uniref:MBL fold metallo-hydrolase n=1 Tax=Pedobacter superstes TaxID=3133441 RepID=UPI0030B7450A
MFLNVASLNSGSNGNCYYVANQQEAILIDAGISCRETEKRMSRLGLSLEKVKAIFISHEHHDHIRGVPVLAKKYQIPVYITSGTLEHGSLTLEPHLVRPFKEYQDIMIGGLCVSAFPKFHDAAEPHSFVIRYNDINVGVFTDIGSVCDHLTNHFKQCHAAFLEANYDEELLERGNYPYHLKKRIRGGKGHLSNKQALEVFTSHKPSFMSHLLLSHLSKDNNCPELVKRLFTQHAGDTEVIVASRYVESKLYQIGATTGISISQGRPVENTQSQYSLF